MRRLLDKGAEPNDLRSLEDLVTTLARAPVEAWENRPVKRRGHRRRRRRSRGDSCASARRTPSGGSVVV